MKKLIVILLSLLLVTSTAMAQTIDEPSNWAKQKVEKAKQLGLTTQETTKGYTENITRQEFATLVVVLCENVLGKELQIPTENPFVDTDNDYILKAYKAGIVNGVDANHFDPDANVTREQIAVMYVKAMKMLEKELGKELINDGVTTSFVDENSFSSWAAESINIANANGIITGVGNNTFNPKGFATREQALVIGLRSYYLTKDVSDVIEKSNEYYKNLNSFNMNGNIYVDMFIEEQDIPMDMVLDLNFDIKESINPIKAKMFMDGSVSVSYLGAEMKIPMTMEEYIVHENDELITYMVMNDPYTGEKSYQKMVLPYVDADYISNIEQMSTLTDFTSFGSYRLVDEEVVEGKTIYKVAMTINIDESTASFIEGLVGDMSSQYGLDTSIFTMMNGLQLVYRLNAETGEILSVEADLGDYIQQLLDSFNDLEGYEVEDLKLIINELSFILNFEDSDNLEVIIPQEVIDNAVDMTELLESPEVTEEINNEL